METEKKTLPVAVKRDGARHGCMNPKYGNLRHPSARPATTKTDRTFAETGSWTSRPTTLETDASHALGPNEIARYESDYGQRVSPYASERGAVRTHYSSGALPR